MNTKYYNDIIDCKAVVQDHLNNGWTIDEIMEAAADVLGQLSKVSRSKAVAFKTVLETGTVVEGFHGNQFMMPATKDCMDNFQQCRRNINKDNKRWGGYAINPYYVEW